MGENYNRQYYVYFPNTYSGEVVIFKNAGRGFLELLFWSTIIPCWTTCIFMNCKSFNKKFRVTMGKICYMFCIFEIYIADLTKRDSAVYFLENTRYTCRHLTLTVTVLEAEPVCSAFLPNMSRDIIVACKWNSQTHKEVRLFSSDQIQYTVISKRKITIRFLQ